MRRTTILNAKQVKRTSFSEAEQLFTKHYILYKDVMHACFLRVAAASAREPAQVWERQRRPLFNGEPLALLYCSKVYCDTVYSA